MARPRCPLSHALFDHPADTLRPISPSYLNTILELLLTSLISLGLPHTAAPIDELVDTLVDEHEVAREVSKQVMLWFGDVKGGKWAVDVNGVVKEIGLGILRNHKVGGIPC